MIIDRFEDDIAVVELDGEMISAPRALFAGANEGDTVELTNLGKPDYPDRPAPHDIFERLRRRRRPRR